MDLVIRLTDTGHTPASKNQADNRITHRPTWSRSLNTDRPIIRRPIICPDTFRFFFV